jgi:hypothetical protein
VSVEHDFSAYIRHSVPGPIVRAYETQRSFEKAKMDVTTHMIHVSATVDIIGGGSEATALHPIDVPIIAELVQHFAKKGKRPKGAMYPEVSYVQESIFAKDNIVLALQKRRPKSLLIARREALGTVLHHLQKVVLENKRKYLAVTGAKPYLKVLEERCGTKASPLWHRTRDYLHQIDTEGGIDMFAEWNLDVVYDSHGLTERDYTGHGFDYDEDPDSDYDIETHFDRAHF